MDSCVCWIIGALLVLGALGVLADGRPSAVHDPEGYANWGRTVLVALGILIAAGLFVVNGCS